MSNIAIRSASALTVMGLSLGVAFVGAPVSFATDHTPASPVLNSNVDFDELGSLTISKRVANPEFDPSNPEATGEELVESDLRNATLRGIEFQLDLISTLEASNWDEVVKKGLDAQKDKAAIEGLDAEDKDIGARYVDPAKEDATKTDANGVLKFENLPVGLYRVTELDDGNAATKTADPFLVFLPMTKPDGKSWNYNVHVYPKNQYDPDGTNDPNDPEGGLFTKTVDDSNAIVGGTIAYTITSSVPDTTVNDVTLYQIKDQLDEDQLDVTEVVVELADASGVRTALIEGRDYELDSESLANEEVVVTFTKQGLKTLSTKRGEANGGSTRVVTTIKADVVKVGDAKAENSATLIHNDPTVNSDYPVDPRNPGENFPAKEKETNGGEKVITYWGNLQIDKVDEGVKLITESPAKFEIHRCSAQGELPKDSQALRVDHDNDPMTEPVRTIQTEGGKVTAYGLPVTNFANGNTVDPSKYCLVEVEAPAGYSLLPGPKPVSLTVEETHTGPDAKITKSVNIENLAQTTGTLPLTGGMGIGLLAALGALIVVLGGYAAKRSGKSA